MSTLNRVIVIAAEAHAGQVDKAGAPYILHPLRVILHVEGESVRLLGEVAAGLPSPAEESLLDTMSLDEYLVTRPEATFMLRVEGDSMVDAGILPGDTVLVERGRTPRNGDIVIACVDGDWTMKYFYRDGGA